MKMQRLNVCVAMVISALAGVAHAQINVGSDGSDGVFAPGGNITIDLNQAVVGNWADPSLAPGKGIYDPSVWAVVFKYDSVNIPAGVTVTFTNRNHANPPVVWLVRNNATIAGTVSLLGQDRWVDGFAPGGPGGFNGGNSQSSGHAGSPGFGPGGGGSSNNGGVGGSFGTAGSRFQSDAGFPLPPYGSASLSALIGGSGGSGWQSGSRSDWSAGGGGGAILVAVGNALSVPGLVTANGGGGVIGGGGGGGGIRLLANTITGANRLRAVGGTNYFDPTRGFGGAGRVRIEANDLTGASFDIQPGASTGPIGPIFPPANTPKVVIASVEGAPAPVDPRSDLSLADLSASPIGATVEVDVNAFNVPSTWTVQVQIKPKYGVDVYVNAARVSGTDAASVYRASVVGFPLGISAIQVRAVAP